MRPVPMGRTSSQEGTVSQGEVGGMIQLFLPDRGAFDIDLTWQKGWLHVRLNVVAEN